jgi:hypothetical protein
MALNIEVNSQYKLTSDSMNVIVNRKHIVDPTKSPNWEKVREKLEAEGKADIRIEWREVSYHRTVENALNWISEQTQRDSNAESIAELLDVFKAIQHDISGALAR